jgi:hypothetical protein
MPAATTGLVMRELDIALIPYRLVFALNTIHHRTWRILDMPGKPTPRIRQDHHRNLFITGTTTLPKTSSSERQSP